MHGCAALSPKLAAAVRTHFVSFVLAALFALLACDSVLAQSRTRFEVAGRPAFLLMPKQAEGGRAIPWVWYAPNLPRLPGKAEEWMFEQFFAAGVAVAGVDVGESYGSPAGRRVFTQLYDKLVKDYGLSPKPCLLARSRGGLMLYNWAVEHPEHVAGIAGIYPVCNLVSYPGLGKACGAYGLGEAALAAELVQHNPIDRLAPLAAAGVEIFHIHGDQDRVVPLNQNSGVVDARYRKLGGSMQLMTVAGQGHNMWRGFFESQELVDFVIERARTTKGLIGDLDGTKPKGAAQCIGPKATSLVPEKSGEASKWVFDGGVYTASPAWDSVVTKDSYRDFRMHLEFNVNQSNRKNVEANGNSGVYIQQRYEIQIHDSFGIAAKDYKASFCGSLYRLKKPDQFVAKPAGEWQSYDIAFRAPVFRDNKKVYDARITVYQNGKLIHDDYAIPRKTGAGQPEGDSARPIKLQGHNNPVRFRNFWIVGLRN